MDILRSPSKPQNEPEYLHEEDGQLFEKTMYKIGKGVAAGGLYGGISSLTKGAKGSFKIRLNAFLNGFGKYGIKTANSVGVILLMYNILDIMCNYQSETDDDPYCKIGAAAATGFLYKITSTRRKLPFMFAGIGAILGFGDAFFTNPHFRDSLFHPVKNKLREWREKSIAT